MTTCPRTVSHPQPLGHGRIEGLGHPIQVLDFAQYHVGGHTAKSLPPFRFDEIKYTWESGVLDRFEAGRVENIPQAGLVENRNQISPG